MINLRLLLNHRPTRPALSMVEVMISTVIVGVLITAALSTVGASKRGQLSNANHRIGQLLAQELMSEILPQMYEEPDLTPLFGPEAPETADSRANYDDVDDYHGWNASPPQDKDGTQIPDRQEWTRSVSVEYADLNDVLQKAITDSGLKRITVTVTHNKAVVASLTAVRTRAADDS